MTLPPGTVLGPYRILSLIGQGGMGEVYRAHDSRLKRDIAVKVLPDEWAGDAQRVARFHREAELLATLNHPNIAAIYGFEESGGARALLLEMVEGPTLADRISRGSIPASEAISIAHQLRGALDAAHERGIVHRDLKPANIKITPDGVVKVLDFGLAKMNEPATGGGSSASDTGVMTLAPTTMSPPHTEAGVILGTAAYMSPEQARGQAVDKRADIWAFGCVFYEMLTGRPPFQGATVTDLLAAILEREPDWSLLPASTPESIRRLIARCLEKNLKRRLRDIGEAVVELEDGQGERAGVRRNRRRRTRPLTIAAGGVLVVAVVGIVAWAFQGGRRVSPSASSADTVMTQLTDHGGTEEDAALSPDGRSFVFVSDHGGTSDLWLRQVSGGEPVRLTNDAARESDPAHSPDGESIYFTRRDETDSGIWRTGMLGGPARKIVSRAQKPAVSHDGRTLAFVNSVDPIPGPGGWEIATSDANGGGVRVLVSGIASSPPPRPAWSSDGRWLAYSSTPLGGAASIFVVDVATGQQRKVTELASSGDSGQPAWLPDSRHLVVPYKAVERSAYTDLGVLDVSTGSMSRLTTTVTDGFLTPSVSADGARLVATSFRRIWEIWKVPLSQDPDANGRAAVRVVDSSKGPVFGFVSRDGHTLLYRGRAGGTENLWIAPVDASAPARQITTISGNAIGHHSLSPDGTRIAFVLTSSGQTDIWTQNVDGSGLRQLTNDDAADSWPIWSPNGQWIAYQTFRGSRREEWRVRPEGGTPEKFLDEGLRGDWIRRPDQNGSWIATAGNSSVHLIDAERQAVVWTSPLTGTGYAMPMFSSDGRSISAVFLEGIDHTVVRIFDAPTGQSRVAVRLPFLGIFRASWIEDDRSLLVNRQDVVRHIVLLERFWN